MQIKVGDIIHHGGEAFQIVHIKHEEMMEGMGLFIQCVDPETADHEQQKKMKSDQVAQGVIETIRKMLDKGGEGGIGFGFPLGG